MPRGYFRTEARELDGVLHAPYAGHRSRARTGAVHDSRVELRVTLVVEHRTTPGVELRIVLHQPHGHGNCVEARATALEDLVAGIECGRESGAVGGFARRAHLRGFDDARATVDDERDWRGRRAARGRR